jgi:hypothetical protein
MPKKIKSCFIVASILFFLISLFQECYSVEGKESIGSLGIIALLSGLFNASSTWICWFANPCYILACIFFFSKEKLAFIFTLIAVVLSGLFYFLGEVLINEGGTIGFIENYKSGYWLWCLSILILFGATLLSLIPTYNIKK